MKGNYDIRIVPPPAIGPDHGLLLENLIHQNICPYCKCEVLATSKEKDKLIAYCSSCRIFWTGEYFEIKESWLITEVGLLTCSFKYSDL